MDSASAASTSSASPSPSWFVYGTKEFKEKLDAMKTFADIAPLLHSKGKGTEGEGKLSSATTFLDDVVRLRQASKHL